MGKSSIEWTDYTFNPWIGCQKVSAGCDHCYAETMMDHRYHRVQWGPHGERVRTSAPYWRQPHLWAKRAREALEGFDAGMLTLRPARPRVFCASLSDVFDNQAPFGARRDLWQLIEATPELDWLLLTKRPENIRKMAPEQMPKNVWLGTTAEDQENFDRRWSILLKIPAEARFVSYEPALGPLTTKKFEQTPDLIICGGESGPKARMMKEAWARAIRDECAERGISFFMKQMTGKAAIPEYLLIRQWPR